MRLLPRLRPRWLWLIAGLVVSLTVGAVAVWRFYEPGWRYEVGGVDVSHHQGEIDWAELADDGVEFAYIKATEGGDWTDPRFTENWASAGKAGLLRGAYHYFTFCRSGLEQAEHFIATVSHDAGILPPAVDLEFSGNCSARPPADEFRVALDAFLAQVGAHFGTTLVIYTNAHFYRTYLADDPPDVIWWVASPIWKPWGEPSFTFWQYFPGRRAGVDGAIDRNVFRGDLAELMKLAAG